MTWAKLVDGLPADVDELIENFYHVAQGDLIPRATDLFNATSGAYDLGSSAYKWDKIYVNEIASTCTVTAPMVFNGAVTFTASPQFGSSVLATLRKVVCENSLASGVLPSQLRANFQYTATALNTITVNQITGATLASNQITLPSGSYACSFFAPMYNGNNQLSRTILFNVTGSVTVGLGSPIIGLSNYSVCLFDTFTLLTTSALSLMVSTSDSVTAGYAGGGTVSFGDREIDARVFIYQL